MATATLQPVAVQPCRRGGSGSCATPRRSAPSAPPPPTDAVEVDDDLVALFAAMAQRRAEKTQGSSRKGARSRPAGGGTRGTGDILPAQEAAASLVAQAERQGERERKERLYGPQHAADVRVLEARLNQAFDHAVQRGGPPMWPAVPLRSR